jgi:gliding motility-associated-like protein
MKFFSFIFFVLLLSNFLLGQDFQNGDLEGPILGLSTTPPNWNAVPMTDPVCIANFEPGTTPDLTSTTEPSAAIGLIGNPYSGNSFISAIAANSFGFVYMEGIQQTVSGFMVDSIYEIHFYQAVVKQSNMKDYSGSWAVYANSTLLGVSTPSSSSAAYNSTNFNWHKRSIVFTATAPTLTIKFLAKDDDDNGVLDEYDASGALRMGIDSLFITPWCNLNADLGPDTLLCAGDSLLLDVTSANAEYTWQDNSSGPTYLVTQEGSYSVSVSNACGVLSDQIYITFDHSVEGLDLGDDLNLCEGDSFLLQLDQDTLAFLWQDGSTESAININETGFYWLELSSANCVNHDTIVAFFNPLPNVAFPNDTLLCEGESLFIQTGLANAGFQWQDNSTNPYYQILEAGHYWVDITENGCTTRKDVEIEYIPKPRIHLPRDTVLCLGQKLRLNLQQAYSDYMWQDLSTSPTYMVYEPGEYFAEVVNECGYDSTSISVDYSDCKCYVYVPNSFTPNGDGRNDVFKVEYDCFFDQFQLMIFDRWGNLIFQSSDPSMPWNGYLKGKEASIGVYSYILSYESYGIEAVTQNGTITLLH